MSKPTKLWKKLADQKKVDRELAEEVLRNEAVQPPYMILWARLVLK